MSAKVSNKVSNKLLAFSLVVLMSGCASAPEDTSSDASIDEAETPVVTTTEDTSTFGDGSANDVDSSTTEVTPVDPDAELRSITVFYFGYDQAQIQPAAFEALKAHARFLKANPAARVRLEGNTDERGTREYNIALGERRGNAVEKFLRVQGVSASQIEVVSYGEERPAAYGHDEASWRLNRRVELYY